MKFKKHFLIIIRNNNNNKRLNLQTAKIKDNLKVEIY